MTSRARVLSKLRAETHWLTWTNLCFFGISSKQRGLQENWREWNLLLFPILWT